MPRSFVLVLLSALSVGSAMPAGAQGIDSSQVAVLTRLYREFSWEATGGDDGPGGVTFIESPKALLNRYLDPALTALVLADRACVRRTANICRLDFAPLWGSQDPDVVDVSFSVAAGRPSAVVAHLRGSRGTEHDVTHVLRRTKTGWRIIDIEYAGGPSLRTLLSARDNETP